MKNIWVIGSDKKVLIESQRRINETGSMRAVCMLSTEAVKKRIEELEIEETAKRIAPSLIVFDDSISDEQSDCIIRMLRVCRATAGVPFLFFVNEVQSEHEDAYFEKGACAVLRKPFSRSICTRIEQVAWQYDMTKSYERMIQKQASDLAAAKEIKRLNEQLTARNTLLYQMFGRYFSDEVVEMMLASPEQVAIGGERLFVTVMMADLRGFTAISESLEAEKITQILNCFFGEMIAIIQEQHGTVIEILGDAILAVFGAPKQSDTQIDNAIRAAILMQNKMKEVNEICHLQGYPGLEMGIGLHCGDAFVGNVGAEQMMRYNVIGPVVNLCSRIESYSLGGQVLASRELVGSAKEQVRIKNLIEISVKGITNPVPICEVVSIGTEHKYILSWEKGETMVNIEPNIMVFIYPLDGKVIREQAVMGCLKQISNKNGIVILQEENANHYVDFSDVKLVAEDERGNILFSDVYAKIMENQNSQLNLRFTNINKSFLDYVRGCIAGFERRIRMQYGFEKWKGEHFAFLSGDKYYYEAQKLLLVRHEEHHDFSVRNEQVVEFMKEQDISFLLEVRQEYDLLYFSFYSNCQRVRALEFLDYIITKSGFVQGDEGFANGRVRFVFLEALMTEQDIKDWFLYILYQVCSYFENTIEINAREYAQMYQTDIPTYSRYQKRKEGWAFVKTVDIAEKGKEIRIQTLENESGSVIVSSEDKYIMIGQRGEVYDIDREKFVATYVETEEVFDSFERMTEYLPAVELIETEEYISLEEYAHVCYPKPGAGIYAKQLTKRTKIFSVGRNGEYFLGEKGDYMAIRPEQYEDIYIIKEDVFVSTYESVVE